MKFQECQVDAVPVFARNQDIRNTVSTYPSYHYTTNALIKPNVRTISCNPLIKFSANLAFEDLKSFWSQNRYSLRSFYVELKLALKIS